MVVKYTIVKWFISKLNRRKHNGSDYRAEETLSLVESEKLANKGIYFKMGHFSCTFWGDMLVCRPYFPTLKSIKYHNNIAGLRDRQCA